MIIRIVDYDEALMVNLSKFAVVDDCSRKQVR